MGLIIYGGTLRQIEEQKKCKHDFTGVCMDNISRYTKCKKCLCLERDMTEKEYDNYLLNNRVFDWRI